MATRKRRNKKKVSARKRAEDRSSGFKMTSMTLPDGVNLFKIDSEDMRKLEILPYTVPSGANNPNADDGDEHFERTFFTHRGIGANSDTYVCPAATANKRCPVCEHRAKLVQDPDHDEDLVKSLRPKERQLWNIYDHGDADRGVQVWDVSYHLFGKRVDAEVKNSDEDDGYEYFADADDGVTLRVAFEENVWQGNKFYEANSIQFKKRPELLSDELLGKANILDSLLTIEPYEKLRAIYYQEDIPGEDADDPPEIQDDSASTIQDGADEPPKREPKKYPTAKECGIVKDQYVDYEGRGCRVMKISKDGTSLTLMANDDDEIIKAIGPEEVTVDEIPFEKPPSQSGPGDVDANPTPEESVPSVEPSKDKPAAKKDTTADTTDDDEDWDWDD